MEVPSRKSTTEGLGVRRVEILPQQKWIFLPAPLCSIGRGRGVDRVSCMVQVYKYERQTGEGNNVHSYVGHVIPRHPRRDDSCLEWTSGPLVYRRSAGEGPPSPSRPDRPRRRDTKNVQGSTESGSPLSPRDDSPYLSVSETTLPPSHRRSDTPKLFSFYDDKVSLVTYSKVRGWEVRFLSHPRVG